MNNNYSEFWDYQNYLSAIGTYYWRNKCCNNYGGLGYTVWIIAFFLLFGLPIILLALIFGFGLSAIYDIVRKYKGEHVSVFSILVKVILVFWILWELFWLLNWIGII